MVPTTWGREGGSERAASIRRILASPSRPDDLLSTTRRRLLESTLPVGAAVLAGCLDRVGSTADSAGGRDLPVLGWYPGWMREEYPPEDVAFDLLDLLYYANFEPAADGTIEFTDEHDEPNLADIRELTAPGGPGEDVRTGFAVGGWNSSTHYSDAASSPESRERLARNAISLMREYGFEGFEIDWEYPTGGGRAENARREDDVENALALVEECRRQLDEAGEADGREYVLSYSGPSDPNHVRPLDVEGLSEHLDWVNVMSYDMSGPSSPTTAHNAPVYGSPSAEEAVSTWATEGMDRSQLMVGHAFYGRAFDGVEPGPNDDGLGQDFESYEATIDGGECARRIADGAWSYHWDDHAEVPYLYAADERNWVSATDPDYVRAATGFARDADCRGVFCWELSYDYDDELLEAMADAASGSGG
ncbi:glycoside hydrolase family 18 protein [Saliphagus infecundisoli]|uniref:Glycoside hydrolase family 18 protein n=1 Tax=Saliphagus infecundisoli TaxID=1849069 RepID=A0ABD5QGV6_9EURY|nr:glycoside hydrolase family 18 protein [Saliphagus infecundisoli]